MGNRIDDLEKSIADLMTQAGFDENEAKKEAERAAKAAQQQKEAKEWSLISVSDFSIS